MARCRVVLTFPPDLIDRPIAYHLIKDFDLAINILRANIKPNEEGKLLLEVENSTDANIERGLDFLRAQGIKVKLLSKEISRNEEECVDCGACTGVCYPKALHIDPVTSKVAFDKEKCIACEICLKACPMGIIEVRF